MSYEQELYDAGDLNCQYCSISFEVLGFDSVLKTWYAFRERASDTETYTVASDSEGVSTSISITKGDEMYKYIREKGYKHQCFSCFVNNNDSTVVKSVLLALRGDGHVINAKNEVLEVADR